MKTIGIHPKVKASTIATAGAGLLLAILSWVRDNVNLIPGPQWLQGVLLLVVPAAISFLAGYSAPPGQVEPSPLNIQR